MSRAEEPPPTDLPAPEAERKPSRRRRILVVGAVAAAVVLAVVLVWFEPQKLFIDERVDEAFPVAASSGDGAERSGGTTEPAGSTASTASPTTGPGTGEDPGTKAPPPAPSTEPSKPTGPVTLADGEFASIDHDTSGKALVVDIGDGTKVLRLEDLATDNGPDVFVYLSAAPISAGEKALDDDFVDLGGLKGNLGNQNYEVPDDVDLDRYKTVVIWCRRFSSGFGAADLNQQLAP